MRERGKAIEAEELYSSTTFKLKEEAVSLPNFVGLSPDQVLDWKYISKVVMIKRGPEESFSFQIAHGQFSIL